MRKLGIEFCEECLRANMQNRVPQGSVGELLYMDILYTNMSVKSDPYPHALEGALGSFSSFPSPARARPT